MIKSTRSRAALFVGVTLLGVCLAVAVLELPGVIVLLTGAVLAAAMAALVASQQDHRHADGRYGNGRADGSKSTTIAVCVLGGLGALPFIAVCALILAGTDPLAVFLIATALFAWVGVLVVVFLGVYFILRWRGRWRTKVRPVRRSR